MLCSAKSRPRRELCSRDVSAVGWCPALGSADGGPRDLGRRRARLVAQPIPEIHGESCQVRAEERELSQDLRGWQVVTVPPLPAISAALVEAVSAHVGQRRVCHGRNTNQCTTTTTERRAGEKILTYTVDSGSRSRSAAVGSSLSAPRRSRPRQTTGCPAEHRLRRRLARNRTCSVRSWTA